MFSIQAITHAVFAAAVVITTLCSANANPSDNDVIKCKKAVSDYVKTWADAAKRLDGDKSKAESINNQFSLNVRSLNFPEKMDEDDVKEVLSKMRTGIDTAAKEAFGKGASATVREQTKPNLKKGAPRLLDVAVSVH